jgi:hypothetical protein
MLTIERRTTRTRGAGPSFHAPLPDGAADGGLTLRELIALAVIAELAAFSERRVERTFAQVLTDERLEQGLAAGRIDSGERRSPQPPSPDEAVATAISAFEDGLFLVLVDGRQEAELDAQVLVGPDSAVTFLRLVALAGG